MRDGYLAEMDKISTINLKAEKFLDSKTELAYYDGHYYGTDFTSWYGRYLNFNSGAMLVNLDLMESKNIDIYKIIEDGQWTRKKFRELCQTFTYPNFVSDTAKTNAIMLLLTTVGPYLLWCVANWCFTSLMDGEGGMKDMLVATGYALMPLVFSNLLCTGLSWILVAEEANFLYAIEAIGMVWAVAWVFFAMMVTQQYSLGKSVATALLTIVGMALILFVMLLLFYLVQQLTTFVSDLIAEVEFRLTI